jgi:amidase
MQGSSFDRTGTGSAIWRPNREMAGNRPRSWNHRLGVPPIGDTTGQPCAVAVVVVGSRSHAATRTLVAANVLATLEARAKAVGTTLEASDAEALTWSIVEIGRGGTTADYAWSVTTIHGVGRVVARFFAGYDILLTPTMCSPPWPIGVLSLSADDRNAYFTALNRSIGFTALSTHPATRRRACRCSGARGACRSACRSLRHSAMRRRLSVLAAQIERARPWRDRRPPAIA